MGVAPVANVFHRADVLAAPTRGLRLTIPNLTGHPAIILPNGLRGDDAPKPQMRDGDREPGGPKTMASLTFLGQIYGEAKLLALAKAYQDATGFHLKHPELLAAGR